MKLLSEESLRNLPLLIFANKADLLVIIFLLFIDIIYILILLESYAFRRNYINFMSKYYKKWS